jgi:hypothetical protein
MFGKGAFGANEGSGDRVVQRAVVRDRRHPGPPRAEEVNGPAGIEPAAHEQAFVRARESKQWQAVASGVVYRATP